MAGGDSKMADNSQRSYQYESGNLRNNLATGNEQYQPGIVSRIPFNTRGSGRHARRSPHVRYRLWSLGFTGTFFLGGVAATIYQVLAR